MYLPEMSRPDIPGCLLRRKDDQKTKGRTAGRGLATSGIRELGYERKPCCDITEEFLQTKAASKMNGRPKNWANIM